jgi:DNA-binding XRE family transcriptional regulator
MNTGKLIQQMRITAYLTQLQLGEKLGITKAAVSQLEARPDCKLSTLHQVAKCCGYQLHINLQLMEVKETDISITI